MEKIKLTHEEEERLIEIEESHLRDIRMSCFMLFLIFSTCLLFLILQADPGTFLLILNGFLLGIHSLSIIVHDVKMRKEIKEFYKLVEMTRALHPIEEEKDEEK